MRMPVFTAEATTVIVPRLNAGARAQAPGRQGHGQKGCKEVVWVQTFHLDAPGVGPTVQPNRTGLVPYPAASAMALSRPR
jgi:hypothetical protein